MATQTETTKTKTKTETETETETETGVYTLAPKPDWVIEHAVPEVNSEYVASPRCYGLVDFQIRVHSEGIERFFRTVTRIQDTSCIEDLSQHLYEVDPDNQSLCFHTVSITRNGKCIDVLNLQNIRAMQRNVDLEKHITSDRVTIELAIDDLRVGDILDMEATDTDHRGSHPLYGRYFRGVYNLSWSLPVQLQSVRVINESGNDIAVREIDSPKSFQQDSFVKDADTLEKRWVNLPIETWDFQVPVNYWPPSLLLSTRDSWQNISTYLYDFYQNEGVTGDHLNDIELSEDLPEIDLTVASERSILATVRFVQNNIRYRSESNGIYTHTPHQPSRTLNKRAGDCKDKSNLMVALLGMLGVKAQLVLVNTSLREGVKSLDPSPLLFNHMIVRFVWENSTYWIDATAQKQAGSLENLAPLSFGYGLVLDQEGGGLVELPGQTNERVLKLTQIIDLTHAETEAPLVEILREYRGQRADNMRYYVTSTEPQRLSQSFLEYASDDTRVKLSVVEPVHINQDDRKSNVFVLRDRYKVEEALADLNDGCFTIRTSFMSDLCLPPTDKHDYDHGLEGSIEHHIQVIYPRPPKLNIDEAEYKSEWFEYSDQMWISENTLNFKMTLTPGNRLVPVARQKEFTAQVNSVHGRSTSSFEALPATSADDSETIELVGWLIVVLLGVLGNLNDTVMTAPLMILVLLYFQQHRIKKWFARDKPTS